MSKTWKAIKKRIKITKKGKLLKKTAGQNHFNTKERGKTRMGKRRKVQAANIYKKFKSLMLI